MDASLKALSHLGLPYEGLGGSSKSEIEFGIYLNANLSYGKLLA
jgi:hypothetical protein